MLLLLIVAGSASCCWSRAGAGRSARRCATALRTGLYLAQAGEFALVLLALATEYGLLSPRLSRRSVLAAMMLSMLSRRC